MKVLIIRNYPSYMAVRNNTYNIQELGLAKALMKKGILCDILFWTDKEETTQIIPVDNFGVISVFYKHGKSMLKNTVFVGCEKLFDEYDILQPCEYNQIQAWLLARKYPRKTVIYHGPYYSKFNERYNLMCKIFDMFFLRTYLKQGTKFIAKSGMAREFLLNKGIDDKNVGVTGVGLDIEMLSSKLKECSEPLYIKMKQETGYIKMLYVGRFEERRNILFIFDIYKMVLEINSQIRLYMIGTGDEEYVKKSFDYAKELGIEDNIVWQEIMEQKYLSEVYKLADFFLLPTEYEIFGMVLLEAMYYNTVVLTTRNGGSSTLIEDRKNGFIIDELDIDAWVQCILRTSLDVNLMNSISESACNTVSNFYTWSHVADAFIEQYLGVVDL